jgi:hypothetical protein
MVANPTLQFSNLRNRPVRLDVFARGLDIVGKFEGASRGGFREES